MTIKIKIILGFVLLMAITIIASAIGYSSLKEATYNLSEVSRYAIADAAASDLEASVAKGYRDLLKYVQDSNEEDVKSMSKWMDLALEKTDLVIKNMSEKETIARVEKIKANEVTFRDAMLEIVKLDQEAKTSYTGSVRPALGRVMEILDHLGDRVSLDENTKAFSPMVKAWYGVTSLTGAIARYVTTRTTEDSDLAFKRIKEIKENLESLNGLFRTDTSLEMHKEAKKLIADLEKLTGRMVELNSHVVKRFSDLETFRISISDELVAVNTYIGDRSAVQREIARQSNISAQNKLFTSSVVGIIIGSILAIVIIIGLIRVLNDISAFASSLARGDFSYKVKTKEKGEIGAMVTGIQQIPTVLQELIDQTIAGVKKIQVGYFKTRLDAKAYSGSYADLVGAVNTVADTYTEILDEMPVPLLTADKSKNVHYTNEASESVLDGKLLESYITEGESDFGINAINSGTNYTAEATFLKEDKSRTMAVTAVPLKDYDGNPAAFIEIITDLTDIKEQQRIMLQVAEEATAISTRVAAASEEIAAQVEQVSRGAEVQRARVESTASAMTEMNATVIEVARSASEAAEQSDGTRAKAQEGESLVNQVMTSINQVNTVSQNLHSKMQELGTQAENIGSVMNVISDIADQTNLLALNAAIEAARAGEAGRGFAVVADEVRKLAEKTMQATQEVGSSISSVQHSARTNIEEVNQAVKYVEEANQLANSSGQALTEIVNLASANSGIVTSIATAAEEQSATSDEISNAISEINTIVGETSEGMVQSSAAIQELSSMAQDLQRVMSGLR